MRAKPVKTTVPVRVAGALLLTASLAACTSGTAGGSASPGLSPAPAGVSAPVEPTADATAPAPEKSDIPAGALLQPSDVRGAESSSVEGGEVRHLRPLRPCGDSKAYPSDKTRTAAVAVRFNPLSGEVGSVPSVVIEFVGRHSAGGAAAQFDEISDALKRCKGSLGENKRRWTVLDTGIAGDESVLVRIDEKFSYGDEEARQVSDYAAVARTGDLIVVVADTGWENIGASEKLVKDLIGKAVERAGSAG